MNLINELRMLAEDLHVNGYNRYSAAMSKAADELESLQRYRTAFNEWIDKTEWVQADTSLPAKYLGMHRADVLKDMISELLDRLEAAEKAVTEAYRRGYETGQEEIEKERDDVAQQLVQSEIGKREISEAHNAVTRRLSVLADENTVLQAKIAEMEKQEPVEWQCRSRPSWGDHQWSNWKSCSPGYAQDITKSPTLHDWQYEARPLYALPGAQPAPSVPEGWIQRGMAELEAIRSRQDDDTLLDDRTLIERIGKAMLAAAPEAKP